MSFTGSLLSLSGGVLIGFASALLLLAHGRIAGVSGILAGIVSPRTSNRDWRVAFLLGLVVGGAALAVVLPNAFHAPAHVNAAILVAGGVAVGLGARVSGGCTSGHGVTGIGRLSKRSIVATTTFMATGMITVALVRVLGGAS